MATQNQSNVLGNGPLLDRDDDAIFALDAHHGAPSADRLRQHLEGLEQARGLGTVVVVYAIQQTNMMDPVQANPNEAKASTR
jgi:hypothetical protein